MINFFKANFIVVLSTIIIIVAAVVFFNLKIGQDEIRILIWPLLAWMMIFCLSIFKKDPVQWSIFGVASIFLILSIILVCYIEANPPDQGQLGKSIFRYCWDKKGVNYFKTKGDWIAIIIAFVSMVYAVFTWQSQRATQQNTQGVTPEVQKGIMLDYGRHNYRNLAVLGALTYLMEQDWNRYPSEDHLLKLQTDDRSIYPEAFDHDMSACSKLHKFKLNIRNGNIEIKTTLEHLKNRNLEPDLRRRDLNKLLNRMDYIMKQTRTTVCELYSQSRECSAKQMLKILNETLEKDSHDNQQNLHEALETPEVKAHLYYSGKKIDRNGNVVERDFVKAFFPDETDMRKDRDEHERNHGIKQLKDISGEIGDESNWKITTESQLIDYINAEIRVMLDKNGIFMMPFA